MGAKEGGRSQPLVTLPLCREPLHDPLNHLRSLAGDKTRTFVCSIGLVISPLLSSIHATKSAVAIAEFPVDLMLPNIRRINPLRPSQLDVVK